MKKYRLNIDGKEVFGLPGQTILEVARENDIFIPTLCYDERTEIYGSCGLCMVEIEGSPKLFKSCATEIAPDMVIKTDTEAVCESRKTNLELLLSNHVGDCQAPCTLNCPANTDCQGYVGLIANGQFAEALELIKTKIPLPAAIGRVCPHPCEDNCRRDLVDDPIGIMELKRFAADYDLSNDVRYQPEIAEDTGKAVAIIGGGPMGLSAASFLKQMGHEVTIFEAMPKLGGMLRYGIPEYRLPKAVLDEEIKLIEEMGVEMIPNTKIGEDISFETIRKDFDAVLLGIGAWVSTGVGCAGEDAKGVIGGIDFLRQVVRNEEVKLGEKVAIVGGGNTAMDACRTAVRLGAKEVYNIYRRTRDEMPADALEIEEALEEGVIFKNLTNPIEYLTDENGHVNKVNLQIMELGEPDESGRRRPVAVEGKTELLDVDTVILAIGQAVDSSVFDVDKTRKNAIAYDEKTFMTSVPGVFAGGDCGNDKISIAIEAIADAKKVSEIIDAYLDGEIIGYEKPYYVERDDITEKTFEDRERMCRVRNGFQLTPEQRKDNFSEVVYSSLTEEEAMQEASRCLECGCHDYHECKLVDYANDYDVEPARFCGEKTITEFEDDHPFIVRDPNKCILCGLCVRACDEVMGIGALGLVNRGFDTVVLPTLGNKLSESGCISCGQCVSVCPVGALQERQSVAKEVPLATEVYDTTCSFCSVGCSMKLEAYGDMLIKANPDKEGVVNAGVSCGKGKWGFDVALLEGKLVDPMIKDGDNFCETDYYDAFMTAVKKMESIKARNGKDAIAVAISDRYTNEEAYAIKKLANLLGAKTFSFNLRENPLAGLFGHDASPNTIDELISTEVIVAPGFLAEKNPVIRLKIKQAIEKGAKAYILYDGELPYRMDFCNNIKVENSLDSLKEIAKALLDMGKSSDGEGFDEFKASLNDVKVSDDMKAVADAYANAKKAMFVYQQNILTVGAARLIGEIAILSGHIGSPRDGILMLRPKNNTQGLVDMGIREGRQALEGVKGLMIFGEDPDMDLSGLEFLAVSDIYLTDTAAQADIVIPGTGACSVDGTFTNTERRLLEVTAAVEEEVEYTNWEIAAAMAEILEEDFGFESTDDISVEMDDEIALYKYGVIGEVLGGVLEPVNKTFIKVEDDKLSDELETTDNLMKIMVERLPKPVRV
jgi:formate dehydrogenase major subunit